MPTTRWQGMTMAIRFIPLARPTARTALGEPTGMPVGPGRKLPPPDGTGIGLGVEELVGALREAPAVG